MNRCTSNPKTRFTLAPRALFGALLVALSLATAAQTFQREFPKNALRGTLVVTSAPQITLDGKADRLSPGARIRSAQNMLVMSGAIVGQELVVNYTRESAGMVHEVWILTPEEAREKRMKGATQRPTNIVSDPNISSENGAQLPFDQLPKYKP